MSLPTFFSDQPFDAPTSLTLGEDAAHHMRVRRVEIGSRLRILDGAGRRGEGVLTQLAKRYATVSVDWAELSDPGPAIHLLLPVADKDRMLWLAEKAAELGVASWRPVLFKRSRHVNPRGEGPVFQQKVRARMASALEQSGGAWLPAMYPDAIVEHAISAKPDGVALVLDAGAPPLLDVLRDASSLAVGVSVVIGPEGGYEASERAALEAGGFLAASIGSNVLRFETAAIAAIAAARAVQDARI